MPVLHPDSTTASKRNRCLLLFAFVTFFLFAVAQITAAIIGNSLALLSDSSTMVGALGR